MRPTSRRDRPGLNPEFDRTLTGASLWLEIGPCGLQLSDAWPKPSEARTSIQLHCAPGPGLGEYIQFDTADFSYQVDVEHTNTVPDIQPSFSDQASKKAALDDDKSGAKTRPAAKRTEIPGKHR